jgi:hypothetical protein
VNISGRFSRRYFPANQLSFEAQCGAFNTSLGMTQVIFVSFFFRPAALQMLVVALATPALTCIVPMALLIIV